MYVYGWASKREVCIIASIHSCTSVPMCARVRTRRRASRLATHICSCVSFADVSDTQQRSIILSTVQHLPTSCQQCSSIAHVLTALHRFSIADHYTCPSRCNGGCGGYWFHAATHGRALTGCCDTTLFRLGIEHVSRAANLVSTRAHSHFQLHAPLRNLHRPHTAALRTC